MIFNPARRFAARISYNGGSCLRAPGFYEIEMAKIDLRKQIKRQMKKQKISVPVMARKLECHPGTIYDYLSGKKALGADYLEKLLHELGAKIQF